MKVDSQRRFLWVVGDSSAPGGAAGENVMPAGGDKQYRKQVEAWQRSELTEPKTSL